MTPAVAIAIVVILWWVFWPRGKRIVEISEEENDIHFYQDYFENKN